MNENGKKKTCSGGFLPRDLCYISRCPYSGGLFSGVARKKGGVEKHAQAQLNPWMHEKKKKLLVL